ncbi:MAG: ribosome-associated translation inhibitor RaiA [Deltaproteobacteria bacterium]|nr:ribosome-associated translation inhibitor RaiA [Deltaproteobacteria bacterium]MCB9788332.1 ribosome-associated translation inhibitor RaiA [Deltaproteobacteria bacterium]
MKTSFTFRHMDSTEALKNHTLDKLQRLSRYEDHELDIHAIYSVEKRHMTVEFTVTGNSHTFVCRETREDMYEAIDLAVDKLDRQLRRDKTRRKHHKGNQGSTPELIG